MKKIIKWVIYWLVIAAGVCLADTYSDLIGYWIGFLTCSAAFIIYHWGKS